MSTLPMPVVSGFVISAGQNHDRPNEQVNVFFKGGKTNPSNAGGRYAVGTLSNGVGSITGVGYQFALSAADSIFLSSNVALLAVVAEGAFVGVKTDGTLRSFGYPSPTTATNVMQLAVSMSGWLALKTDGTLVGGGSYQNSIPTTGSFSAVFAGGYGGYAAIKSDGSLVYWGYPSSTATTVSGSFVDVAFNYGAGIAQRSDGTFITFGSTGDAGALSSWGFPSSNLGSYGTTNNSLAEGGVATFVGKTSTAAAGTAISYMLTGSATASDYIDPNGGQVVVGPNGRYVVNLFVTEDNATESVESITFASSGNSATISILCFVAGTRIATGSGPTLVENLCSQDIVRITDGIYRRVLWIGQQRRTPEFARFEDYLPVKISAGALDDNLPIRDLYLSPDHAVLVDGHLVHAKALVNGKTIVQMTDWAGDIEYYHIETEAHDIIYAEGVPCETFIDNVSREQFDNYAEYQALYPNTRMMKELPLPRVKFKRQLPTMIKQRLESRISELDRQHKV